MMPSERLSGPRAKIARANQHIRDLYAEIQRFRQTEPCEVRHDSNHETGQRTTYLTRLDPFPDQIVLITGDALHNLRSALDHLAAQLVCVAEKRDRLDGESARDIAFPIGWNSEAYVAARRRQMSRALPAAQSHIDGIEPYRGGKGEILWRLHQLDIADKHRLLLSAAAALEVDIVTTDITRTKPGFPPVWAFQMHGIATGGSVPVRLSLSHDTRATPFPLKAGDILRIDPIDSQTYQQMDFRLEVALNEAAMNQVEPIVKTLKDMAQFIDALLPTFEGLLEAR